MECTVQRAKDGGQSGTFGIEDGEVNFRKERVGW